MTLQLRELGPDDRERAVALGALAFGGDPAAPVAPASPGSRAWGAFDGDRLLAKASVLSYTQWWGGRRVPMGGLAGVAVHPDARGSGVATRLVRLVLAGLRLAGQPVSALFPTAPAIYRPLGWEVVGGTDETVLPTAALQGVGDPAGARLRSAGPDDLPALTRLWSAQAADGQLTRDGPAFPRGAQGLLAHDVVQVAEQDGVVTGYVAYDRGRGYGPGSQLQVAELVAATPGALAALLRGMGTWDGVASTVLWRGPVDDLRPLLRSAVPVPVRSTGWMLRITDAPAAVAARGFRPELRVEADVTLLDPEVPEHEGPWHLSVRDGEGRLERATRHGPRLHVRGLAMLYAGAAGPDLLLRTGLLSAPVPGLAALGPAAPVLLDDF